MSRRHLYAKVPGKSMAFLRSSQRANVVELSLAKEGGMGWDGREAGGARWHKGTTGRSLDCILSTAEGF